MRVYYEVARRSFARAAAYRTATAAGVFTNTAFAILLASILLAVFDGRSEIGGFSAEDTVTYTFVAQGLLVPLGIFGGPSEFAQRIRSGDVVVDLYRPVDFQGYWAAVWAGASAYHLVFRGVPPVVAGLVLFPGVSPPASLGAAAGFLASVVLAIAAAISFRFAIQCAAFWLLDSRGPVQLAELTAGFFSGVFVPLHLFPPALAAVAGVLPFAAMVQWPIEVYLGARTGTALATTLAAQAAWAVALAVLARVVAARATVKVVVQGG